MVLIITGASHTGKTTLAQKILERCHFPYFSIDHLKMGMIRSGYTDLTAEDDDKLTAYLWPIVREMIKTAIENRQNLTVEGVYIPFDWEKCFEKSYLDHIRCCCLVMTDNYIKTHFDDIKRYADITECRPNDDECTIDSMTEDNACFAKFAQNAAVCRLLIDKEYKIDIESIMPEQSGK